MDGEEHRENGLQCGFWLLGLPCPRSRTGTYLLTSGSHNGTRVGQTGVLGGYGLGRKCYVIRLSAYSRDLISNVNCDGLHLSR